MTGAQLIANLEEHPFRFIWPDPKPISDEAAVRMMNELECRVADLIYHNEPNPASPTSLSSILMPFHQNGTFVIGERFNTVRRSDHVFSATEPDGTYAPFRGIAQAGGISMPPPFIRDEEPGLENWAKLTAYQDLQIMEHENVLPAGLPADKIAKIPEVVAAALWYRGTDGLPLHAKIPNQNYIDYFRRAIALFLTGDVDHAFHTESKYNATARRVAFAVIASDLVKNDTATLDSIKSLMVYSLLAGVIGLDMKCSHCAASALERANTVFFDGYSTDDECHRAVRRWLAGKADDKTIFCPQLFAWDRYADLVLRRPCKLIFFPDDVAESIFDMYRIQAELSFNPDLSVIMFPRNGRFHNDLAYEDVEPLLEEPCFTKLRDFSSQGRFVVSPNGPRNGAVEAPKLSAIAVDVISQQADVVFAKGSRSYELLATGMRVPTFGAQTASREFSESVLGADAQKGVPALTFFHAFPDFWGFKERCLRVEPLFPTGRADWQARMTAIDSARFTNGKQFSNLVDKMGREAASEEIMEKALADDIAPHQILM